ncbi:MAG: Cof-type HAD-IIB family hydrolase [Oscillospiraceae bacterium]|nr:Cof-type HAD-IIB family hydrolase [Oscillospiraceae bacterium]
MGKTLFISDLDGTLLNTSAQITPTTAKIINGLTENGLIFTYATARSFHTAQKVTGEINFKYPIVCRNGEFIQNPQTGDYFDMCFFDKDKIDDIISKFEINSLYPLVNSIMDGRERVSWITGKEENGRLNFYLKTRENDKRLRPVNNYSEFFAGDIHGIGFFGNTAEELQKILEILKLNEHFTYHIQKDTYQDENGGTIYWLEIMRFDATKDAGVKKVQRLVGADKIVCFGDNINDIPMFNVSDEKYAVENAISEVKDIADCVIGSNDEDGVAKWLEKYAGDYM